MLWPQCFTPCVSTSFAMWPCNVLPLIFLNQPSDLLWPMGCYQSWYKWKLEKDHISTLSLELLLLPLEHIQSSKAKFSCIETNTILSQLTVSQSQDTWVSPARITNLFTWPIDEYRCMNKPSPSTWSHRDIGDKYIFNVFTEVLWFFVM